MRSTPLARFGLPRKATLVPRHIGVDCGGGDLPYAGQWSWSNGAEPNLCRPVHDIKSRLPKYHIIKTIS